MFNKYKKYIYSLIIFYFVWLVLIPLGFRFIVMPAVNNFSSDIRVENPRLYTYVLPNINLKADNITLLNDNGNHDLLITRPQLNFRILPLLSGKIHINRISAENVDLKLVLKDKFYIGKYPLDIKNQNINLKTNCVRIDNLSVLTDVENADEYKLSGKKIYYKSKRKYMVARGNFNCSYKNNNSTTVFNINLPHNKNLKKTKFNIDVENLNLEMFSEFLNKFTDGEISSLNGIVNIHSTNKKLLSNLNNIKINCRDKNKSIIFPEKVEIVSQYRIKKDAFQFKKISLISEKVSADAKGEITHIFSKTPYIDISTDIKKSDIRIGAMMLPPIVTPDISIPKLKEYPFYGQIYGNLKIKGKFPKPDIKGNIKVSDGVLINPIPQSTGGANINIDFIGKQLLLDVIVPAGGREVVYVSGDIMIYDDRYAHLKVRSSKSVDLNIAETVLNPLHEILCFMIGPVPIMDIEGRGNIDINIEGTKTDPHIWGDFNFKDTSARFLEVNNLVLEHADGNLNFNNQNVHFINRTGVLHGKPATIDGTCNLFGVLDFNVTAKNQELNDMYKTLVTSPLLENIKATVPKIDDIKGKCDFILNLKGKLYDIKDLKLNENVFPSGTITLYNNSIKTNEIPVNHINGVIGYNKNNSTLDINANISSASVSKLKGSINDGIADIRLNSPKININELCPQKLKHSDTMYIKLNAGYKGNIEDIEIGGIDADIDIISNGQPVKNGKIYTGKIKLKNSNLFISNLKGIIKQNPFNLNLKAYNIGNKKLNLSRARINGEFNCKDLDLTVINLITKANILPYDIQKEIQKINFQSGKASVYAKAFNNRVVGDVNLKKTNLEYKFKQGQEQLSIPINILSGNIKLKNNNISLNKFNCLVDSMPVLIYGDINNYYRNPRYKIHLNSKLIQKVFDRYWNANNIYPVKMNGDILYVSTLEGDKNHTRIKSDIRMESNSNIYYMGATIGDVQNPITVNLDADINKNGWIKLNKFKYNKLIASQNNKQNALPLLIINGELKNIGKIYAFKNLCVKTENPANANFFNIIFKKPTIKSGKFTSDIVLNGTSNRPKIIGKFFASNMEMPYLNTSIKDLNINFKPDNIQVVTKGTVLDNYIMISAAIKNNFNPPYKINSADIYINDLDLNNSINQLKQMELKGFSSAISPDVSSNEIISSLVCNDVKIRAGNVLVKNIKASNLNAVCSLNNKMQMSVDSFKFNMASGVITGKINYNLLNNYMQMELDSQGVNANELSIALFDLPNQIYGSLTGHIELNCNATNDKTRLTTLSGFGSFNVVNGKMPKLGSLEYLLRASNLIKGGITSLSMNGLIDIVTPMKTGEFSSIDGRIRLKDGVAKTLEIRTLGKNLSLYIIGSLNLYTSVADMHVYGQLSKKVSTVLGAAGNISLNTLFNKIPGISLNSELVNELNKIPGIELSNKSIRRFMVEILGDVNSDSFVKSFKWIN